MLILGIIGGSTGIFSSHFWSHFGIKNHKKGMSKASQMEPGSQTPPWDALGSILESFWVDVGHCFWTKKPLKIDEETVQIAEHHLTNRCRLCHGYVPASANPSSLFDSWASYSQGLIKYTEFLGNRCRRRRRRRHLVQI